jgi:hypothetical protein
LITRLASRGSVTWNGRPLRWAKAIASSRVSKFMRTCGLVSALPIQPISGSTVRGVSLSNSSTHFSVLAVPDCMALRAGR